MNTYLNTPNYFDYSKPHRFLFLSNRILPVLTYLGTAFLLSGLYLGLCVVPVDFYQGENYKIIYIHVPFAWMSTLIYVGMVLFSLMYIIRKNAFMHLLSVNLSLIGILCTIVTLLTGSLWGLPIWGTLWVWDARLTSVLILLFIYVSYYLLATSFSDANKSSLFSSVFCLFGFFNIPIIKFSVNWWTTLHQPSSISLSGSSIHISMIYPILLLTLFLVFYVCILQIYLVRRHLLLKKIDYLMVDSH